MPTITYVGDYGSPSVTLYEDRTANIATEDTVPSVPVNVRSCYARFGFSTSYPQYQYRPTVALDNGYSGVMDYTFPHGEQVIYVNVPIDVGTGIFDFGRLSTVTVGDESEHPDKIRVRGTVRVVIDYMHVDDPVPPYNVKINGAANTNAQAGTSVTMTWDAGTVGAEDEFVAYRVYQRSESGDILIGSTNGLSLTFTAPYVDDETFYYYVVIACKYKQAASAPASVYTWIPLTSPVNLNGGANPLINPRPMLLMTMGQGLAGADLSLLCPGWTASRDALPGEKVYLKKNARYQSTFVGNITVTETDGLYRSLDTDILIFYTPPDFTDDIEAGTTVIKAVHITELQNAFDMLRASYGLTAYTWTPCVAGVTPTANWVTHISEFQACAREIAEFINAWDPDSRSFHITLPAFLTSYVPSAAVMNQIRTIVTML